MVNMVRRCDMFGAAFSLKLEGESNYKTIAGGLASVLLKVLIGVYFIMQITAVVGFRDP